MASIKFSYNRKEYTLRFSRTSVMRMEQSGFDITQLEGRPYSAMITLFRGAFIAEHPDTKSKVIDQIWDNMPNKDDLINALIDLYQEPFNALMEEPDEAKKVSWKVTA